MLREQPQNPSDQVFSTPVAPWYTPTMVTEKISSIVLNLATPRWWWIGFILAGALLMLLLYTISLLVVVGTGIWGINAPVGWGVAIINLVFWIGIGHAGTLISAILVLFRQNWRTALSRFAEAMTLFALACATLFPVFHLGRPWLAFWLAPYPNALTLWPQWRSPLVWDFFAISTYTLVSALFWYIGLIPDLAAMKDKAQRKPAKIFFGLLSFGWRGESSHWARYQMVYIMLAALATPLVISVHSIIGMDFASAILPGWHHTVFPPYFVAGAIFSGLAMVILLAVPLRVAFKLQDLITERHIDNAAKLMLVSGMGVAYGYLIEIFGAWYGGHESEWLLLVSRMTGPYAVTFWGMLFCNIAVAQLLWFRWFRHNKPALMVISLFILIGMWLERFVIVVTSLYDADLNTMERLWLPTEWDVATTLAPFGLFFILFFIFIRLLPMIPIFETQEIVAEGTEK
jgi:molybdopterin-containing oxidoreductase family membrane subunit